MKAKRIPKCSNGEHSAILLTFIKLPFVIMILVLSIFEWQFYTGFTVPVKYLDRKIKENDAEIHNRLLQSNTSQVDFNLRKYFKISIFQLKRVKCMGKYT